MIYIYIYIYICKHVVAEAMYIYIDIYIYHLLQNFFDVSLFLPEAQIRQQTNMHTYLSIHTHAHVHTNIIHTHCRRGQHIDVTCNDMYRCIVAGK